MNTEALKQKRGKRNARIRKLRAERKTKGLCVRCGIQSYPYRSCEKHRREDSQVSAKRRAKLGAEGRCVSCGKPSYPCRCCAECLAKKRLLNKHSRGELRKAGRCVSCGRVRWDNKRCVYCQEAGEEWRIRNNW